MAAENENGHENENGKRKLSDDENGDEASAKKMRAGKECGTLLFSGLTDYSLKVPFDTLYILFAPVQLFLIIREGNGTELYGELKDRDLFYSLVISVQIWKCVLSGGHPGNLEVNYPHLQQAFILSFFLSFRTKK